MNIHPRIALACLPLLTACTAMQPPASVAPDAPPQWHAPLPHGGSLTNLSQWWKEQGDTLLVQLIEAAQNASPTIASARTRIEQARAARVAAGAALAPRVDATASAVRTSEQPQLPMGTTLQAGLQTSWEIDVFGGGRAARDATQERLQGATAAWHDARVSVAAEVATQYYVVRTCEQLLAIAQSDAGSRAETSRLTDLAAKAGFQAPATSSLARASAAEGSQRAMQQRAQCDVDVKTLVALTAIPEPELRQKLAAAGAPVQEAQMVIASLPAQLLAQRPDIFAAEREVAAASADVGSARAQRFPRLVLSGSIGRAEFRTGGTDIGFSSWSLGPLAMSVPVFDGGAIAANADAAQARYEEAVVVYRARVRNAVREVEEALVSLQSTAARRDDARTAVEGYRASYDATEARYKGGLGSLFELEDSRRTRLVAETTLVLLERERRAAWVALYRAAGGGWNAEAMEQAAR
ncbi:efflux transporter outer membrane subunit [Herbaspirillum sp. HC18]|nr:efflux transporter outer membrane subunit [Herbaspirillum sp. HC18]